ncbi:UNVERIFIED_CONTAM: hypothetical protein GTU68_044334, partial [Idotea baltica]|nr:hypothetical protein [Idotea baltica]
GIWVFVNLLPSLLCITNPRQKELGWRDFTGWALFIVGFLIETVADYQKSSFRNEKANQDKFISSGLWSLSRHPNYFGEVLLWFGLYVSASSVFQSWQFLTVFCPVLEYLLISKLSGVPFLEGYALKKWGTSPKYQEYLRNTPVLVPFWH